MADDRININFEGLDRLSSRFEELSRNFERLLSAQERIANRISSDVRESGRSPRQPQARAPRPPTPAYQATRGYSDEDFAPPPGGSGGSYRFYTPTAAPQPPGSPYRGRSVPPAFSPYTVPGFSPWTPFASWSSAIPSSAQSPMAFWSSMLPGVAGRSGGYARPGIAGPLPGGAFWSAMLGGAPTMATSSGGYARPTAGAPLGMGNLGWWSALMPGGGAATGPGVAAGSGGYALPGTGAQPAQTALQNLSRLNLEAFRTYTTLQTLGQRNRDQGFLGRQDMQQWERASQHWKQFEREAAHTVAHAQQHLVDVQTMPGSPRAMAMRVGRAQAAIGRATAHQAAMHALGAAFGVAPTLGGPAEDEDGAGGGARGSGMFARGFAGFQHAMRQARDIALGVSVAGLAQHGMHLADQRARGITHVGMLTGMPFGAVGAQLDALRAGRLHMRAEDILRAQLTYGRLAGTTAGPGLENALLFGTAHGMDPARAAEMGVLMGRMSTGPASQATALGAFRQATRNRPGTLSGDALTEEFVGMMQQTAGRGIRLPSAFFGRFAGMLTEQNPELMQVPGAMQQRFGEIQQGIAATPNDLVTAMKMRGIAELAAENRARGKSNVYEIGGVKVPIDTTWGMKTAIEEAGSVPDFANAIMRHGRALAGDDPNLQRMVFQSMTMGGQLSNLKAEQANQAFLKTGGYPSTADDANARYKQQLIDAERIHQRNLDPNFKEFDAARAAAEKGLEVIGSGFLKMALNVQEAIGKTGEAFKDGLIPDAKQLGEALLTLKGETVAVIGLFQTLSAQSIPGLLTGLTLVAAGAAGMAAPTDVQLGPPTGDAIAPPWGGNRYHLRDKPNQQPWTTSP